MHRILALAFAAPTLVVALVAALVLPARADGLDKARIPADARWFAHLDVEALVKSELYRALEASGSFDLGAVLDDVEGAEEGFGFAELGIEPARDLKSIALYSVDETSEHVVVLVVGNAALERAIEELVKPELAHRLESIEGRSVHVWGEAGSAWYAALARREGSEDRLVVQSDDAESLKRALAVLDGRAPSLAPRTEESAASTDAVRTPVLSNAARATPAPGSILFAVATTRLSELAGIEAASNVARLAQDVVLDVGETKGELFAKLAIDAKDAKEARQVQQVLQGAVALFSLAASAGDDEGGAPAELQALQELAAGFRFETDGKTMHAEFRIPVRLLIDALGRLDAADDDHDVDEER